MKKIKNVKFEFVKNGTTAEQTPEKNTIWIDVGNKMEKGILDHHGEENDNSECAAEMVYKHPEFVLQNITNSDDLTIVGHILPDFDCVASAYLVKKLAENGELSPEMEKIVEYARLTDTGKIRPSRNDVRNPYSILNAEAYMPQNANVNFDELNQNIMKKGFELIEYCLERIRKNPELSFDSPELIEENSPFMEEIKLLEEASKQYEEVVETAEETELTLPTIDGKTKKVPGIFVKKVPQNELTRDMMKNWLRNDGYVFTSIAIYDSKKWRKENGEIYEGVDTSRAILSVAPDQGVNLKGLGELIEEAENEECKKLGIIRFSKSRNGEILYTNRPGYNSPDPWYDGRGHKYEIIDGPMAGSVLSISTINEIAKAYSKNNEIREILFDENKDLDIPQIRDIIAEGKVMSGGRIYYHNNTASLSGVQSTDIVTERERKMENALNNTEQGIDLDKFQNRIIEDKEAYFMGQRLGVIDIDGNMVLSLEMKSVQRKPKTPKEEDEVKNKQKKIRIIRESQDAYLDRIGTITYRNYFDRREHTIEGITARQAILAFGEEEYEKYFNAQEETKKKEDEVTQNNSETEETKQKIVERLVSRFKGIFNRNKKLPELTDATGSSSKDNKTKFRDELRVAVDSSKLQQKQPTLKDEFANNQGKKGDNKDLGEK